ncbi:MAG: helix-turn-helix transcriptional regulator, partial [Chloroflexi bacterium]|nr:helix-turn-helix transcriptional regulator [Chloroflexota bacterium]
PEQVSPEAVLASLVNDLDAAGRQVALVLDDYHFISSPAVHSAVAFLLEHCPRTFHLVIASRSDPALPMARLRARGQMVELRAADLSFTGPEAAQFLNEVMGLHLDAGAVALLEERTEGWIAGLQMAALSMRDRGDVAGFIQGFSGTNRYILDYLLEEVLASQPPEVQHFLLYTSVLKRLTAPLCDAILQGEAGPTPADETQAPFVAPGQAAGILDYLERANLFLVPLDDERRWYRYHHLFADLLQARLTPLGPGLAGRLLGRAATWCDQEGYIAEAVEYALASRDVRQAGDLIARYWHLGINNGEIETVSSWLRALPEEEIRRSASLGVAACWVLWFQGQMSAIEARLVEAEKALDEQRAAGEAVSSDLPVLLAVLRSIVARYGFDFEAAVALARRAQELMPEDLPPLAAAQLDSLIYLALASAYDGAGDLEKTVVAFTEAIRLSRLTANAAGISLTVRLVGALRALGRLNDAEQACREALRHVQEMGLAHLPATGILHLVMGEVLLERNDLAGAEAQLSYGMELGKWSGRLDAARNAAPALVRLRQARGDDEGALAAIQAAQTALGEPPPPLALAELLALRARVLAHQGAVEQA